MDQSLDQPGPAMNEWNELLKAELLPPSGSFRTDGDAPGSIKCAGLFQGSVAAPGDCGLYHRHPQKVRWRVCVCVCVFVWQLAQGNATD